MESAKREDLGRERPDASQVRGCNTELVWPGKYDDQGHRRRVSGEVAEFKTLEIFHPAIRDSEKIGNSANDSLNPASFPRNRLIFGDNLVVMNSLLEKWAGRIDLIYLDPPFGTGSLFEYKKEVGKRKSSSLPPKIVRSHAYRDSWDGLSGEWFSMMFDRLERARELLSERGTLYLHLDWAAGHHVRPILDEIFGPENSLGEIVWAYGSPSGGRAAGKKLVKAHDLIFMFAKRNGKHRFRNVYLPYSEQYVKGWFKYQEEDGRRYRKRWRRDSNGVSFFEKQYLDESKGVPASTVWKDIQQVYADPRAYKQGMSASEITGYPTQKPMRLLERILEISTDPGDVVADLFCGSGTTLLVAEKLGRQWIGCDCGVQAIHTATQRLIELPLRTAFQVQSLVGQNRPAVWGVPNVRICRSSKEAKVVLESPSSTSRSNWAETIDRWAVDWNYKGVFVPTWCGYRTRKERDLPLESVSVPVESIENGLCSIVVQVADVKGAVSLIFVQKDV